jgi:hypothetical protein
MYRTPGLRPGFVYQCPVRVSSQDIGADARIEVIALPWWETVLFLIAAAVAIWGFISIVGLQTRRLTRRTGRTAENLYPGYADSARKQRRYARQHGGQWHDDEPG